MIDGVVMNNERRFEHDRPGTPRDGERGAALILAVLVSVILSLLGISYLMLGQTESTIAENERNAAISLYVAETGARLAVQWFNDPSAATGYLFPTAAQIDRTKRLLDHDDNPATARVLAASGDASKPLYKDSAITLSTPMDRPYRSALAETFLGIETGTDADPNFAAAGPDLIVSDTHLATINNALFASFPTAGLSARIVRIEMYSPPVLTIGGAATRMGIATIKVEGGVFIHPGTPDERQIASRIVKAVINELPVPGPAGPLQSCGAMQYNGSFEVNWGAGASVGDWDAPNQVDGKIDTGLPYALNDPFSYINGANTLADWAAAHDGETLEDPWVRFYAGGLIDEAPNTNVQPWPHTFPGTVDTDHSNLFQNTPTSCPTFDYNLWKSIAQSGAKNHFYFTWNNDDNFQLDGRGPILNWEDSAAMKEGVLFFDTKDGLPPNGLPYDDPGTNLTPLIDISGGSIGWAGMIYINASTFRSSGVGGIQRTLFPPGEVGDGSGFVNFEYPADKDDGFIIRSGAVPQSVVDPVTGKTHCVDYTVCPTTPSAVPVQDETGLPIIDTGITLDGVMYIAGIYVTKGNDNHYGSVIAEQGVLDGGGNPGFYFDESLVEGDWPREGMNIPRVAVSVWQTDL